MAKSANQKLKLLYLLKILNEKTDETHCLSAQALIAELAAYDIRAERKSIYDDIECLTQFGYDIVNNKSRVNGGYYLASREFELPELKLLVDAVQASRFITQKKSRELIGKIEKLAGPFEGKHLQRQVVVSGRIKTENESIYYNVDHIHNAITDNVPISFTYLEWTTNKVMEARKSGKKYHVSPFVLIWRDENYYLIAYDDKEEKIKHFRVDKMNQIQELSDEKRKGIEVFQKFDITEYTNRTFGMYGGTPETVTLCLPAGMIGIILDRFGKETDIRKLEDGQIRVRIKATLSGQFFGWLTGLGDKVHITAPQYVKEAYCNYIKQILFSYEIG